MLDVRSVSTALEVTLQLDVAATESSPRWLQTSVMSVALLRFGGFMTALGEGSIQMRYGRSPGDCPPPRSWVSAVDAPEGVKAMTNPFIPPPGELLVITTCAPNAVARQSLDAATKELMAVAMASAEASSSPTTMATGAAVWATPPTVICTVSAAEFVMMMNPYADVVPLATRLSFPTVFMILAFPWSSLENP